MFLSWARGKREIKEKRMDDSEKLIENKEENMQEVKIPIFDGQEYRKSVRL